MLQLVNKGNQQLELQQMSLDPTLERPTTAVQKAITLKNQNSYGNSQGCILCTSQEDMLKLSPTLYLHNLMTLVSMAALLIGFCLSIPLLIQNYNNQSVKSDLLFLTRFSTIKSVDSSKSSYYITPFIFYFLILIALIIFLKYKFISNGKVKGLNQFTLVIQSLQQQINLQEIKQAFKSIINQQPVIELCLDYRGQLAYLSQICTIQHKINSTMSLEQSSQVARLIQEKDQLKNKIDFYSQKQNIISIFIILKQRQQRAKVVQFFQKRWLIQTFSHKIVRKTLIICDQQDFQENYGFTIKDYQIPEPQQILWENNDLSFIDRLPKFLLVFFILFLALSCSVLIFGLISVIVKTNMGVSCSSFTPTSSEANAANASSQIKLCYCKQFIDQLFQNPTDLCSQFLPNLIIPSSLQIGLAVFIVLSNYIFAYLVKNTQNFLRASTIPKKSNLSIFITVVVVFINSVVIPIFVSSNIRGYRPAQGTLFPLQLLDIKVYNLTSFNNLSIAWFQSFSLYFIALYLVQILTIFVQFIYDIIIYKNAQNQINSLNCQSQNQIIQATLPVSFDYVRDLSFLLTDLLIAIVMGSAIPLLFLCSFLSLLSRLLRCKYTVLKLSKKIKIQLNTVYLRMSDYLWLIALLGLLSTSFIFTSQVNVTAYKWTSNSIYILTDLIGLTPFFILIIITICLTIIQKLFRRKLYKMVQDSPAIQSSFQDLKYKSYQIDKIKDYKQLSVQIKNFKKKS